MENLRLLSENKGQPANRPPRFHARTLEKAMKIKELWDFGYSRVRIGILLGAARPTISRVLCDIHGIPPNVKQAKRFLGRKRYKITERDEAMKSLWDSGWPCSRIATEYGISRQRVLQILHRAFGELPKHEFGRPKEHCSICNKVIARYARSGLCGEHYWNSKRVLKSCTECGSPIIRRASDQKGSRYNRDKAFCNRKCFGRWLGKHYGGGRSKKVVQQLEEHLHARVGESNESLL